MSKKHVLPAALTDGKPVAGMSMSASARMRMKIREKPMYKYYNDMGANSGNCTWGAGILAHLGVCSVEELGRPVNAASIDLEYGRRVAIAERIVRRGIDVSLNQAQFDALCSLAYNVGPRGVTDTFGFVNRSDFAGAAANMLKMIKVTVVENGKKKTVVARGLIPRRAEESAPFRVKTTTPVTAL